MISSRRIVRQYAIFSFLLALVEFLIAVIIALDIASNACQHQSIINNYDPWVRSVICHPFLTLLVQPIYYEPIFTLWLIIVIPTTSFILATFSFLKARTSKWKLLSILGIIMHILILLGILIEIKYEILLFYS